MTTDEAPRLPAFSISVYKEMLEALCSHGYSTIRYSDAIERSPRSGELLLRHDVDFSLELLAPIGLADHQAGLRSTFFIQTRSPLYNVLSPEAGEKIEELISLGHEIGLHHDPVGEVNVDAILVEMGHLDDAALLTERSTVSLHRPGSMTTSLEGLHLAPRLHHAHEGRLAEFRYFSDSACRWRRGMPHLSEEAQRGEPIQVLTHPLWWLTPGDDGPAKLKNFALGENSRTLDRIRRTAVSFEIK